MAVLTSSNLDNIINRSSLILLETLQEVKIAAISVLFPVLTPTARVYV